MNHLTNSGIFENTNHQQSAGPESDHPWFSDRSAGVLVGDLANSDDSSEHGIWTIVRTPLGVDVHAGQRAAVQILHCPHATNAIEITDGDNLVDCELTPGEPETERVLKLLTQAICREGAPAMIRIDADAGIDVDQLRGLCDDFDIELLPIIRERSEFGG